MDHLRVEIKSYYQDLPPLICEQRSTRPGLLSGEGFSFLFGSSEQEREEKKTTQGEKKN